MQFLLLHNIICWGKMSTNHFALQGTHRNQKVTGLILLKIMYCTYRDKSLIIFKVGLLCFDTPRISCLPIATDPHANAPRQAGRLPLSVFLVYCFTCTYTEKRVNCIPIQGPEFSPSQACHISGRWSKETKWCIFLLKSLLRQHGPITKRKAIICFQGKRKWLPMCSRA